MTRLSPCFGRRSNNGRRVLRLVTLGACLFAGCRPTAERDPVAGQEPAKTATVTAVDPAATDAAVDPKTAAASPAANAALWQACKENDRDGVGRALQAGADVNKADDEGRTALMWACFDGRESIVATLLEHKARINDRDTAGRTALMYASTGAFRDTVRRLLLHGAEVNLRDQAEGFTALMFAAAEGQLEVVKELLAHHADRKLVDVDGDTAADFARRNGHAQVVQVLEQ